MIIHFSSHLLIVIQKLIFSFPPPRFSSVSFSIFFTFTSQISIFSFPPPRFQSFSLSLINLSIRNWKPWKTSLKLARVFQFSHNLLWLFLFSLSVSSLRKTCTFVKSKLGFKELSIIITCWFQMLVPFLSCVSKQCLSILNLQHLYFLKILFL